MGWHYRKAYVTDISLNRPACNEARWFKSLDIIQNESKAEDRKLCVFTYASHIYIRNQNADAVTV